MNTKTISDKALSVIDQYKNFRVGTAVCSVPYYNNRVGGARAKLRALIGKGSPKDIFDEVESQALSEKIDIEKFTSESLKRFLIEKDIGIDCSGLAYYILNAESQSLGKGSLDKHISFVLCKGIISKIRCKIRPAENADTATFAHQKNSEIVNLKDSKPGDIITMSGNMENKERDHMLVIHQIEYQNFTPTTLHYTHAIAWPTDGEYGHGVRQGVIEITDINKNIVEQRWIEKDKTGDENYTFTRARKSLTSLRRLRFL